MATTKGHEREPVATWWWLLLALFFYAAAIFVKHPTLRFTEFPVEDLCDLFRDIAIALSVGVYLAWTLEGDNARKIEAEVREYIHAVGENFIQAVYGKQMPDDLFQVVKATIFDQSFVRSDYETEFHLHDIGRYIEEAPPEIGEHLRNFVAAAGDAIVQQHLLVRVESEYQIRNVDVVPRSYPVSFKVLKPFGGRHPGITGVTSAMVDDTPIIDHAYLEDPDRDGDPLHLEFTHERKIAPGAQHWIRLHTFSIRRRTDTEPWAVSIPCNGMTVEVFDHGTGSKVLVSLSAPNVSASVDRAEKDPATNKARLQITQYLLPYQGMTIDWSPEKS